MSPNFLLQALQKIGITTTPLDIQFEEINFQCQFSVSTDKLYELNIDSLL
jgi:hypothetical protein